MTKNEMMQVYLNWMESTGWEKSQLTITARQLRRINKSTLQMMIERDVKNGKEN